MRRHREDITDSGHDSFLDIVANLVGILVILIMVLGVRAKQAWRSTDVASASPTTASETDTAPSPNIEQITESQITPKLESVTESQPGTDAPDVTPMQETPTPLPDVETPRRRAEELRQDAWRLENDRERLEHETLLQRQQRDQIQLAVTLAEKELPSRRASLDRAQQEELARQQQLAGLDAQLQEIQLRLDAADDQPSEPTVIEHHPTPMAKTVFGKEQHFRLERGRLAYVPLNELVSQLKDEAERKIWKLENAPEVSETIGPLDGFRIRYTLRKSERLVSTPSGPLRRQVVDLAGFVLLPIADDLGEPIATALSPGSQFGRRLSSYDPHETTITVWTYPGSFAAFRQLKEFLWQRGYLIAARPLPDGYPIGGSPDGSRSAAE